jgi:small-conductance mechanosensitive channel
MRLVIALVAVLTLGIGRADAAEATAAPQMTGWFENAVAALESEAMSDVSMVPDVWSAIGREWRSFDRNGSAAGILLDLGWVALVVLVALLAERGTARTLSRRPLRRMARAERPRLLDMLSLVACDVAGLGVFIAVFTAARRHFLPLVGITDMLAIFAAAVLVRWRLVALILRAILRPGHSVARLVDIPNEEAGRLQRFVSSAVLAVIVLVGFGRVGLMDEDSGASHVIGLVIALLVCGLYVLIAHRARVAAEALIRGQRTAGLIAALRRGLARAWMSIAVILVAGLFVFFVAGLSLGLLRYYHAVGSTLGILFIVLVLDRLTERVWHDTDMPELGRAVGPERLHARAVHHILRAIGLMIAALAMAWVWSDALEMSEASSEVALRSAAAAVGTLFVAFVVWELVRLAIDRHLEVAPSGPSLPGDDDDAAAPASRLQTILPLLRAAFAVAIGVVALLIALSNLGVNTAPLIAGAGVFGLAVSFGSQSLVRDIISGLFYMWDDAFRVGEYIDTGRLKGTVETLGIRSVKLRHQNGPLHTIPYGQLGAVTNLSRDFATIKFNLRLEPGTDIELVRKTVKQIGLSMQEDNPELAAEVMLPLKLQGIAEVVDNAVVLRFKFTARPVKPSWVQREYLKRMVQVFAEKGIQFASGALTLQTLSPPDWLAPPPAKTEVGAAEGTVVAAAAGAVELPMPMPTAAG